MRTNHLIAISPDGELRRYEHLTPSYQGDGKRSLKVTHEAGFVPLGNRAKEIETIERFRKFPDARFGVDTEPFQPEDYLWMAPGTEGC